MTAPNLPWVVVTGAAGALGRAIVAQFADRGQRVLALDLDASSGAGQVQWRRCDLANPAEVDAVLDEALPRGERVDLLVNAAGLIWSEPAVALKRASFVPHAVDSFHRVLAANLTTTFVMSTRIAARMARVGGGAIINFSSIAARGNGGQVAYSAAKAGVEGLTRAMAQELGPLGIRVNAIAPGFIDVGSTRAALTPDFIEHYTKRTPLRRLGSVAEVADAIDNLYRNAFMNGVVLDLDGGLRL